MRVLVTGGAGFIGSHIADALIEEGAIVSIVDDLSTGFRENVPESATFYESDICDPALRDIFSQECPEVIIHNAAQMSVRVSVDQPILDAQVNVLGTLNVIESAKASGARKIIYSSTGACYGDSLYLPCDENHPLLPLCQYGITKHTVEHYLDLYHRIYGLEYTAFRYPNVYGPRQDPNSEAGVIAIFIGQMLRGERVVINGSGDQERDFVYIDDIVRANLMVLETDDNRVFNLGSGKGTSVIEIFTILAAICVYKLKPTYGPSKAGEAYKIYLNADQFKKAVGWQPMVSLQEGLARTVTFFRENTFSSET